MASSKFVSHSIRALLLIVIPLLALGCGSKEEKVSKFIEKGDKLLAAGDTVKAILEYKNAIQIDPKDARARFALGKGQLAQKEIRPAYGSFKAAIELDPGFDEARLEAASLMATNALFQEALEELAKMTAPQSLQPRADIVKARALVGLKKYVDAILILREIKEGDANAEVQALLSISYHAMGDENGMEAAAARWREADRKSAAPYLLMAQHAAAKGDKQRARDELEAMVKAHPQNTSIAILRAKVLNDLKMEEDAEAAFAQLPKEELAVKAQSEFFLRRGDALKAKDVLESYLATAPSDVDAVIRLTSILVSQGNRDSALQWLEKTLQQQMASADQEKLLLGKASILADQGKIDDAKKLSDEVLQRNQGNLDAHFLMGNLLFSTGKPEEAEIHLNQTAVGRPDNARAQLALAQSQFANKKEALALETLKNGVKANPLDAELRIALVRAHMGRKETDLALKALNEGIELKANDIALLRARGELLAFVKDYDKAEADFQQIVTLQPKIAGGYLAMGALMLAQSNNDKAVEWLKKALETENGWQGALPSLLKIYFAKNEPATAIQLAEAEAAKHADAPMAHFLLGQAYLQAGRSAKAEASFVKASQIAPDWMEPYQGIVQTWKKEGKPEKALAKVEELQRANEAPAATLALAMLMEEKGRTDEATSLFQNLIDKTKESPSVMNDVAFLLAERRSNPKDLVMASELITKALAKEPQNPAFLDTAAWISYKHGNVENAWEQLQRASAQQPDIGSITYHLAIVAHAKGDKRLALEYLDKALQQKIDAVTREAALKLKKEWES